MNTQAVNAEALYERTSLSSFHGVFSTAGFTGAFIGLLMMKFELQPFYHFIIIAMAVNYSCHFFSTIFNCNSYKPNWFFFQTN